VYSPSCFYTAGTNSDSWEDKYLSLYIWCCENRIPNMIFIWSADTYRLYQIKTFEWKTIYPQPENFLDLLIGRYGVGFSVPIYKTVRETILAYPGYKSLQMFVSPGTLNKGPHLSKTIP